MKTKAMYSRHQISCLEMIFELDLQVIYLQRKKWTISESDHAKEEPT
jgi:hypothetical protein